jgi:hypothetical protein
MRRLILEVQENELTKVGIELPIFKKIKTLQLLYFLRQDQEEFAAISRVEFKDSSVKANELLVGGLVAEAQVIEKEKNGAYIIFMRSGPSLTPFLSSRGIGHGYLFPPIGIDDGKLKFSFVGSQQQIKGFMEGMDRMGIHYRVVLLAGINFLPNSPLNQLTDKQREVLTAAYKLGYYDIPRKTTSQELADVMNMADSTFVEHLRKAEQRLITHLLEQ